MKGDKMFASSDSDFQIDYELMKLSKENCDEIFGVINIIDLAERNSKHSEEDYIEGFNKAMEIQKDKLFTVEDMGKLHNMIMCNIVIRPERSVYDPVSTEKYIQSLLQQPTEIEVRIAMGCGLPNGCTEPEIECTCEPTYNLDENGCLTLWVLNT
jgi:hypothetical protein